MKTSARRQTVVVVGAMNPAIHYPVWYAQDPGWEQEFADVLNEGTLTMIQPVTSFKSKNFLVQCTAANWTLVTSNREHFDRAVDLTRRVFTRLGETPISAFGLNFDFEAPLRLGLPGIQKARENLGAPEDLNLSGFVLKSAASTQVVGGIRVLRRFNATVALDGTLAKLSVNVDHQLPADNHVRFDFSQVLDANLDAVDGAQRIADRLLEGNTEVTQ